MASSRETNDPPADEDEYCRLNEELGRVMVPGHAHRRQEQRGGEDHTAEAEVEEGHLGVGPIGLAVGRTPVGRAAGRQRLEASR